MADIPLGRFCWYELLTSAPEAAPGFYGPIAGWTTDVWDAGEKPYTMWVNGEAPIGGVMELPAEAIAQGAPPNWLVHISTPDLQSTMSRAVELGGTIMMGPMHIPEVGGFAVVQDPQGAIFATYQPAGDAPGHDGPPRLGEFSWNELMTTDREAAWAFYSGLFGWEEDDAVDMGPIGLYQMFNRGAHPVGAIFNKPLEVPVASWLFYIHVPDADAAAVRVRELGGTILNGPMEVPGGGRIAQCMDAQGAAFAVHSEPAQEG